MEDIENKTIKFHHSPKLRKLCVDDAFTIYHQ